MNTLGSYRCACDPGYELTADKKMCEGWCRNRQAKMTRDKGQDLGDVGEEVGQPAGCEAT